MGQEFPSPAIEGCTMACRLVASLASATYGPSGCCQVCRVTTAWLRRGET